MIYCGKEEGVCGKNKYDILKHSKFRVVSINIINEGLLPMPKRTYQPKKRHASKKYGFRARMSSNGGQKVLKSRRLKGRARLSY